MREIQFYRKIRFFLDFFFQIFLSPMLVTCWTDHFSFLQWPSCRGIASLDLKVAINKMRDIFLYQKRFDEENSNFAGASHFFAIFALLRRENGTFYGERKQETTTVYFSLWTWIWSLGIQLQKVSPTFDKVSGRVGRNNRDNDWKNAINFF